MEAAQLSRWSIRSIPVGVSIVMVRIFPSDELLCSVSRTSNDSRDSAFGFDYALPSSSLSSPPLLPLRMETDRREIGRNRKRDGANTISVHNRYGPLPAAGTERPLQKSVQIKKKIRAG